MPININGADPERALERFLASANRRLTSGVNFNGWYNYILHVHAAGEEARDYDIKERLLEEGIDPDYAETLRCKYDASLDILDKYDSLLEGKEPSYPLLSGLSIGS